MIHGIVPTTSSSPEILRVDMVRYGTMPMPERNLQEVPIVPSKIHRDIPVPYRENCREKRQYFQIQHGIRDKTYRLKKGNTYLLVLFTPDSFRFKKKITKENDYYAEQYLSGVPWSFDLKITYMD